MAVRIVLAAALLVLVVFTCTKHRIGANVRSRFITVERLLQTGSFSHDGSPLPASPDAVMIDGKIYSSKQPTYILALAATAAPIRAVTGFSVFDHQRLYMRTLVLLHQVVPYLVLLWFAARWVAHRTDNVWVQTTFMLGLSFACLPFGYAVTLNNHTPTAVFLFFTWWIAGRILDGTSRPNTSAFVMGLLGGLATSYELTSGIFTPLFGLIVARKRLRYGVLVVAGAVLATLPMFLTYYAISGSPVPFYLQDHLYDYPGSYWRNPTRLDALNEPKWLYTFNALLGHHGLFSLSPYLALGWIGLAWQARNRHWLSGAVVAGAMTVISYILYKTHNYGGNTLGMRWFSQFAPLFAVGALPVLVWMEQRTWARWLCYFLLALSSAIVLEALINTMFSPGGWIYGIGKVLRA